MIIKVEYVVRTDKSMHVHSHFDCQRPDCTLYTNIAVDCTLLGSCCVLELFDTANIYHEWKVTI